MNHRILGRGAIACSAVVATQWIPAFDVQLPGSMCQQETEPEPNRAAGAPVQAQQCSFNGILALLESLPERFKLQWSQSHSDQLPGSIEREYQQMIEQARSLAGEDQVAEAIALMNAVPKNSRYFDLAYQMQETWSQDILHEAASHYQQAELATALKLLEAIPATSSQYPQATQLKQKWQQEAARMQQAIAASKAGAWQEVIQHLEAFKETPLFQSLPVQELLQLALIKVLEPDPALLQITYAVDSTSLSAAPPASMPAVAAATARAADPLQPPAADRFNLNPDRVLAPAVAPSSATKTRKPTRQAMTSQSASLLWDNSSATARSASLSPAVVAAVNTLAKAIAEPERILQK